MSWSRRAVPACAIALATLLPAPADGQVVGACHVSPVVADLDRSLGFYRDALGLEVSPPLPSGPVAWDTRAELPQLHGLPAARIRSFAARVPGAPCGIEPVEFAMVDRKPVRRRMQDAGAVTLILLVRDIDAAFARLKQAGAVVVTAGGAPVLPSPTSKTRAVIVEDPDGHFVELAQLEPAPATDAPTSSNVFDIRFRLTVNDIEQAAAYYRDHLGLTVTPGPSTRSAGVMAMMGQPETAEFRVSMNPLPGSEMMLELLELKGVARSGARARVQDPGAYRLQLDVADIDARVARLTASGSRVISAGGAPVRQTLPRPSRLAAVEDPGNLFLILRQ